MDSSKSEGKETTDGPVIPFPKSFKTLEILFGSVLQYQLQWRISHNVFAPHVKFSELKKPVEASCKHSLTPEIIEKFKTILPGAISTKKLDGQSSEMAGSDFFVEFGFRKQKVPESKVKMMWIQTGLDSDQNELKTRFHSALQEILLRDFEKFKETQMGGLALNEKQSSRLSNAVLKKYSDSIKNDIYCPEIPSSKQSETNRKDTLETQEQNLSSVQFLSPANSKPSTVGAILSPLRRPSSLRSPISIQSPAALPSPASIFANFLSQNLSTPLPSRLTPGRHFQNDSLEWAENESEPFSPFRTNKSVTANSENKKEKMQLGEKLPSAYGKPSLSSAFDTSLLITPSKRGALGELSLGQAAGDAETDAKTEAKGQLQSSLCLCVSGGDPILDGLSIPLKGLMEQIGRQSDEAQKERQRQAKERQQKEKEEKEKVRLFLIEQRMVGKVSEVSGRINKFMQNAISTAAIAEYVRAIGKEKPFSLRCYNGELILSQDFGYCNLLR
ncbi:uncharacterized protein MONOS_8896 [Monocercomonoides exilis]|uniref:uncharacterized protein n=1 Tax=Monocercomonoides exilis TaxID=2049356 RepID=UPI003559DFF6|nr:hypothetical protein MONOS_8896 [Monocercomonoides exilis]|eukprot:MONOS_8896.1-p1 / transcript=MONOS_8896.1 / gene=MONOS_8896 / organism=Monocercomonoides_exilis_PA203 / gene_product=unspecified product / transcript_product=unspecified product / location=Mono_scaffold00349:37846-39869(+) / protein_length=501 / sequence_SO=supercontig / SO=protein_coding / is_pseudo=false